MCLSRARARYGLAAKNEEWQLLAPTWQAIDAGVRVQQVAAFDEVFGWVCGKQRWEVFR
jgi:hypothetical protein